MSLNPGNIRKHQRLKRFCLGSHHIKQPEKEGHCLSKFQKYVQNVKKKQALKVTNVTLIFSPLRLFQRMLHIKALKTPSLMHSEAI